jgi:hypothetical protein
LKIKIVTYEITHCNSLCLNFYHNYEDDENCWCAPLNKKIFDVDNNVDIFCDLVEREFPEDCPLDEAKV